MDGKVLLSHLDDEAVTVGSNCHCFDEPGRHFFSKKQDHRRQTTGTRTEPQEACGESLSLEAVHERWRSRVSAADLTEGTR